MRYVTDREVVLEGKKGGIVERKFKRMRRE